MTEAVRSLFQLKGCFDLFGGTAGLRLLVTRSAIWIKQRPPNLEAWLRTGCKIRRQRGKENVVLDSGAARQRHRDRHIGRSFFRNVYQSELPAKPIDVTGRGGLWHRN